MKTAPPPCMEKRPRLALRSGSTVAHEVYPRRGYCSLKKRPFLPVVGNLQHDTANSVLNVHVNPRSPRNKRSTAWKPRAGQPGEGPLNTLSMRLTFSGT